MTPSKPEVLSLYDEATATLTYVVFDPTTRDGVIIDSVLDFDPPSGKVSTESLEKLKRLILEHQLNVHYILETHAHADHLSGAQWLKNHFPQAKTAVGERITEVQGVFKKIYNLPESFIPNGKQFDQLLKDGETLQAGSLDIKILATPGHTPACLSYLIGDAVFTGDALFMPDTGTGRCDFPKGSSEALFRSITRKLYVLPESTRVFVGHDYKGGGKREARWESSIGEEKNSNIQLKGDTSESEYRNFRDTRDATLSAPRLLLPSLQVNIRAGHLPESEDNGVRYLKLPLKGEIL